LIFWIKDRGDNEAFIGKGKFFVMPKRINKDISGTVRN